MPEGSISNSPTDQIFQDESCLSLCLCQPIPLLGCFRRHQHGGGPQISVNECWTLLRVSLGSCSICLLFFFLLLIWICENEFTCSLTVTSQDCPAESPAVGSCGRRIKVPSGENTELQCSPFTAWSRPYYSHACYAYCQGFLHYFYSSPTFSQNLSRFLSALAVANIGSCVGPQNKMGPPAGCRFPC